MNMVRMKDVAKYAGVSVGTVSNVVTGKQKVSEEAQKRVRQAIEALNYQVNLVARGLKSNRTYTIGVAVQNISVLFNLDVLQGIEDAARQANYHISVLSGHLNFETERENVEYLRASRADGIILASCCRRENGGQWARRLTACENGRYPVVLLEQNLDEERVSCVVADYFEMSRQVTRHLLDLGRRNILYIGADDALGHSHLRLEGYRSAMRQAGLTTEGLERQGDFQSVSAYRLLNQAIEEKIQFDAVQCANDQMAIGALKALKEWGIAVPEKVAVAGFDNLFPSTLVSPQVTTVDVPGYTMGQTAFSELARLIENPDARPQKIVLPSKLIVRQSTDSSQQQEWELDRW